MRSSGDESNELQTSPGKAPPQGATKFVSQFKNDGLHVPGAISGSVAIALGIIGRRIRNARAVHLGSPD